MKLNYLFIIVFSLIPSFLLSQTNQELEELKQSSFELFNEGDYQKAMPLYSQLLSLYPSEAIYSYYYGACLVENNKEIDKAIKYLKYSAKKLEDVPQVYFYLGSAYHLSYQFNKAIDQYKIFQAEASVNLQNETQVEREINICNNGLDLVKYISPLTVLNNKSIKKENFEYTYNFDATGGKVALKPDVFKTKADIKQKEKELIFISDSGIVMFSSLGKRNKDQRDIYWTVKGSNGEFSSSKKLSETINTDFDEDHPFLKSDGKTLYFSSKGHNTMGGFDIFKSVYDSTSESWSPPENLDFPTNTPYDDILYVVDSKDSIAYFASMRESEDELVNVYKIEVNHNPQKQTEVKLEEIQQLAKLLTTPLAVKEERKNSKETLTPVATTKVSDYKGTGPKTLFSFEEVYSNHVSSPEDYTKVLRNDIVQLREMLSETVSKNTLASNIAHQKLGKIRELNGQLETRKKALSQKEQIENAELNQLTKELVKTNNQAFIAANVSEKLSKEVVVRKRELKITELLLNDSSNNNTQELVQNINANRNFLEQNNKSYLSLQNFIKEKESDLNSLEKGSNSKGNERSKKLIHFNQNLSDYKACLMNIKNKKDSSRSNQAKSNLNNIKYDLEISKNNLIASEQKLNNHNNATQKLEEEIIFLKSLMNELSDKEHLAHAKENKSLDHQLIIKNAEELNKSTLELQSDLSSKQINSKYNQEIQPNLSLEKKLLADAKKVKKDKKQINKTKATNTPDVSAQKESNLNLNRTRLKDLKTEINTTNLVQVISLDARIAFKKAQLDSQISDSLFSLASEKETRVGFVPNAEQQDIIKDEIVELRQLSNIKAKQAIDGYSSASLVEKNYISDVQPDTTIENLIEEKVFSFESSQDDSPELIEYKKATFKDQYYQSQLNLITHQKEIIEKALEDDGTDPEVRQKFQFDLSELLQKEAGINQKLVETKKTEETMEQLLITKGESYPVSKEQKYAAATDKKLSPNLELSNQQSKALKSINKKQEQAENLNSQWQELVENINVSEDNLSKIEDSAEKEELNESIKNQKVKAWSIFKEANETQQSVNQSESKWLAELIQKQKETKEEITAPLAYVFEKESNLLIKNAANLRENTKLTDNYNPAIAKVIEKAQLYESIAINRQKAAVDIYANTVSSETDSENGQESKLALENNKSAKPQIELLPDEADKIAAYEKNYNQADAKEIKSQSYWDNINKLKNNLETAYSTKEHNNILAKIAKQTVTAKEASYSAYLIRKEANQKKFDLYQEKNSNALNTIKDKTKTAVAKHYILDAKFYKSESEKITVDNLLEASDMLFQKNRKLALEDRALLAQEFAFSTLNGDDISELNPYSSIVKSDPLITKEQPIDKDLVQNVQSNRILKKINLSKSEIKALKKTEKTKKEQTELRLLLTENEATVELLKDSLKNTSEIKLKKKIQEKIEVLDEESISYKFSIAQNAEEINFEKYLAYKNHVKEYRLKGKGNKAKTGRGLEKEANRSIRKAQNLRTRSYDVVSSEKAIEFLLEAQVLEYEALENMEKAYTLYFDLLPIENEVQNYLAKNSDETNETTEGLTVIESKGQVENFELEEFETDTNQIAAVESNIEPERSLLNDLTELKAEPSDSILSPMSIEENNNSSETTSEQVIVEQNISKPIEERQDSLLTDEVPPIIVEEKNLNLGIETNIEITGPDTSLTIAHTESAEEELTEDKIEKQTELLESIPPVIIEETQALEQAEILEEVKKEAPIEITEVEEQTLVVDTFYVSEESIVSELETPAIESSEIENQSIAEGATKEPSKEKEQPEVENIVSNENISVNKLDSDDEAPLTDPIETDQTTEIIAPKEDLQPQTPAQIVLEKAKSEAVLSLKKTSIYNKTNPIPVDPALPSGIVYKIQIGAFTKAIPQNSFNGLTPVSGETRKDSKYIRYFVGLFNAYEAANVALPFIKQSGYKDAFIVAYKDGQRIAIYLAKKEHESNANYPSLAKTETENVLKTIEATSGPIPTNYIKELINPSENISSVSGVVYTVQIGVFKDEVSHSRLKNLSPLFKDFTNSGLIRYMVGRFTDFELANQKKIEIRNLGIKDAFVTAYKAGKKISISQAREELTAVQPAPAKKNETNTEVSPTENDAESNSVKNTSLEAFKPSIYNVDQLSFRVQIGVFSNTVPVEVVSSFIQLSKLDKLDQFVNSNGKTVYTLGSFKSINDARILKENLLKKGMVDAFIIAFDGQQKVPISEALKLLKL